jgi:hypothetical protein
MPDPSVHDNFIYAYQVDCEGRRIILHTAFRDREPVEFTDIVFKDVIAHHFQRVLPSNILFDVEEVGLSELIADNADIFTDTWRHGWPPLAYGGDLHELELALKSMSIRAFSISSSYGMSGWVLAGSSERVARITAARAD